MKLWHQIKLALTKLIQVSYKIVFQGWSLLLDLAVKLHQYIQTNLNQINVFLVDFTTKLIIKAKNSLLSTGLFLLNLVKHTTLKILNLGLNIVKLSFHKLSKNTIKILNFIANANKIVLISALCFLISIIPVFLYLWSVIFEEKRLRD